MAEQDNAYLIRIRQASSLSRSNAVIIAYSVFDVAKGVKFRHFNTELESHELRELDEFARLHNRVIAMPETNGRLYVIGRTGRSARRGFVTWLGVYRTMPRHLRQRPGDVCGAGLWTENSFFGGGLPVAVVDRISDYVHALMRNSQTWSLDNIEMIPTDDTSIAHGLLSANRRHFSEDINDGLQLHVFVERRKFEEFVLNTQSHFSNKNISKIYFTDDLDIMAALDRGTTQRVTIDEIATIGAPAPTVVAPGRVPARDDHVDLQRRAWMEPTTMGSIQISQVERTLAEVRNELKSERDRSARDRVFTMMFGSALLFLMTMTLVILLFGGSTVGTAPQLDARQLNEAMRSAVAMELDKRGDSAQNRELRQSLESFPTTAIDIQTFATELELFAQRASQIIERLKSLERRNTSSFRSLEATENQLKEAANAARTAAQRSNAPRDNPGSRD
jgi:hypothetical protein